MFPVPLAALGLALWTATPLPIWTSAQEPQLLSRTHTSAPGWTMPYRLFVPEGLLDRKLPLVIVLHGRGGIGEDNLRHIRGGNGMLVDLFIRSESQARFPCIVVAPQSGPEGWVDPRSLEGAHPLQQVREIVAYLQHEFAVDSTRVYVAGYSLGAYGALALVNESPRFYAAAVLVAGGHVEQLGSAPKTPAWIFHGERDDLADVEDSRRMAAALRQARTQVRYTEYPGEDHGIMRFVAAEPELLPWLFRRTLAR